MCIEKLSLVLLLSVLTFVGGAAFISWAFDISLLDFLVDIILHHCFDW